MKTQTIVTEITQDDLVNLICTAEEGSSWLAFKTPKESGEKVPRMIRKSAGKTEWLVSCLRDIQSTPWTIMQNVRMSPMVSYLINGKVNT